MTTLEIQELDKGIKQVKIIGRLDIQGVSEIETSFTAHVAGKKEKVIVDLSEVEFIGSIGIRLLLIAAKAQGNRGGKMVLFNPKPLVEGSLQTTGINLLIPISNDFVMICEDLQQFSL